jgi:copper chaperone
MSELNLKVSNMACSACAETITEAVQSVDPQASVKADPKTKDVTIQTTAPDTDIKNAITAAGYNVS